MCLCLYSKTIGRHFLKAYLQHNCIFNHRELKCSLTPVIENNSKDTCSFSQEWEIIYLYLPVENTSYCLVTRSYVINTRTLKMPRSP